MNDEIPERVDLEYKELWPEPIIAYGITANVVTSHPSIFCLFLELYANLFHYLDWSISSSIAGVYFVCCPHKFYL